MTEPQDHNEHPVHEAEPHDNSEWDVVQSIQGFDRLVKLVKYARSMTPKIIDAATGGHPLDVALGVIYDCKQAALLAYGKALWQDAHDMKQDIDGNP